jgi:fluoroacetyl-CoA thioesterase
MVDGHRKQGENMELSNSITPGLIREETFLLEEQHTAYHIGSGDEKVLGTPWMISFMERVSNRLIAEHLPEGLMSVGIHVDVKHLAATPMKATVRVHAEVLEVVKNRIRLSIEAWDSADKIGEGTHLRAVVEKERFMQRVLAKSTSEGSS